ncbi:hypothetical protein CsatB_011318 [Cannabis sativa]
MDNQDSTAASAEPVKAKALRKYPYGAAAELGVIKKPLPINGVPYRKFRRLPPVNEPAKAPGNYPYDNPFKGVPYRFSRLPPIIEHQPAGSSPGEAAKIIWRSYRRCSGMHLTLDDIFIDESIELDENYEEKNDKGFFPAEYGTRFVPRPFLAMAIFVMKEHSKRMDNEVELKYVVQVNQGRVVNWNLNSFTHYLILMGNDRGTYLAKVWSKFIPKRGLAIWFKMSGPLYMNSRLDSSRRCKYWPNGLKILRWGTPPGRKPPNFDWPRSSSTRPNINTNSFIFPRKTQRFGY